MPTNSRRGEKEEVDGNTRTESAQPADTDVELHNVLTLETVENALGRLLDERYTQLLVVGLRYPLTNVDPLRTVLVGGLLLFPLVVASWLVLLSPESIRIDTGVIPITASGRRWYIIPVLFSLMSLPAVGYLVYIVHQSANRNVALTSFPHHSDRAEWKKLTIVGTKGLVIAFLCLLTPLAFVSGIIGGPAGGSFSQLFNNLGFADYILLLGALVLIGVYPATVGTFVEHGRVSSGINAPKRPTLFSRQYLRGIAVVLTLLASAGAMIYIAFGIFNTVAVGIIGPVLFYLLVSVHHVIGLTWRDVNSDESDEIPVLPILKDHSSKTDPIAETFASDAQLNLNEIAGWEVRTRIDRFAVRLYQGIRKWPLIIVSIYLVVILTVLQGSYLEYWTSSASAEQLRFLVLSVAPATATAGYIWYKYRTENTPFRPIAITFVLGAAIAPALVYIQQTIDPLSSIGFVSATIYYLLFIAPLQELGKLLAIRLYAYRCRYFNAVIDGAVYGAFAGLGLVVVLNATMIQTGIQDGSLAMSEVALFAVVSPTHVLFTAFTGYYLGLAKFNPKFAGAIIVKGLLVIVMIRTFYEMVIYTINQYTVNVTTANAQTTVPEEYMAVIIAPFLFLVLVIMLRRKLSAYDLLYKEVRSIYQSTTEQYDDGEATNSTEERIEELLKLYDAGVITDQELRDLTGRI
ncbi:PrsW family glutamic-type intramembrane protease [Natronorubrum sp. DTA7]|uniref:PrsW family glutamic-type intramembrane protease n=1 Tax=Natronorubrum sp. DTA7 TaxID=3447016 RepID=UPI003F85BA3F